MVSLIAVAAWAQQEGTPPPAVDGATAEGDPRGQRRGNFNPEDIRNRMIARIREQFEVTDDAEWQLIMDRVNKVNELRRNTVGGGFGAFRGPGGGGTSRGANSGNKEQEALQQALRDKLPDAEVKSRLDRLREARKQNEGKLLQAQEELRAVLTVRQEALAVMFGLLP